MSLIGILSNGIFPMTLPNCRQVLECASPLALCAVNTSVKAVEGHRTPGRYRDRAGFLRFKHSTHTRLLPGIFFLAVAAAMFTPAPLLACTACAGKSTDALASGMNWGIFTLLGVVLSVLSCLVVFFVHVARRTPPDDGEATPPGQCK